MPYNYKGKWCALANRKCPGVSMVDAKEKEWGCPHWCSLDVRENDISKTYVGCGVPMTREIGLAQSRNAHGVQEAVESNRNEMIKHLDKGFGGIQTVLALHGRITKVKELPDETDS